MPLPVEILQMIFRFLDAQPHLAPLLRVSQLFKSIAEPLLYREVVFRDIFRHHDASQRIQQFYRRITAQPDRRLAQHVVSYVVIPQRSDIFSIVPGLHDLPTILPELVNLHRLKIHSIGSLVDISHSFFSSIQLTHLHCHYLVDPDAFRRLLESQPTLYYLYFIAPLDTFSLPSHVLPRLRVLSTGTRGILAILPGRDIEHLTIHNSQSFSAYVSSHPSMYATVSTLRLQVEGGLLDNVVGAVHAFPNVFLLEIEDPSSFGDFNIRTLNLQFLRQLAATKISYISLILWRDLYPGMMKGMAEANMRFKPFFEEIPTLKLLDLTPHAHKMSYPFPLVGFRIRKRDPLPWLILRPREDLTSWDLWWEDLHLWGMWSHRLKALLGLG